MHGEDSSIALYIKHHLKLVGITTTARGKKRGYVIIIFPMAEKKASLLLQRAKRSSNKILVLLQAKKNNNALLEELREVDIVGLSKQENYYFSFFLILRKLLPYLNLEKIVNDFKSEYEKIYDESKLSHSSSNTQKSEHLPFYQRRKGLLLLLSATGGLISSGLLTLHWYHKLSMNCSIRSDFKIEKESALLDRPELIAQIEDNLKEQTNIQAVALIGPGGSGKTTLARQYAYQQKTSLIWEINAETRGSLRSSFEDLAQALSKTEEDQKVLREIKTIKDFTEKEENILQFVKARLKFIKSWVLIYDNVEAFVNVQKYFPYDPATWGEGKVILTTRDSNIENNKYVNHTIPIGELTPHQKLVLFTKITENTENENTLPSAVAKEEQLKYFLEKIPSFPLDVAIAAYYLKVTNISYSKYLQFLNENNNDFINVQENLLKETGSYTRTRYGIISISLQKLIETHKDFIDLLLFISLLDSQNIPQDLLKQYKNEPIVNNFLLHLKKYSLITNEAESSSSTDPTFSMHRSTQAITLSYLTRFLNLEKNKHVMESIVTILERYIEKIINQEALIKKICLKNHCQVFLSHTSLLTNHMQASMGGYLGCIYYHLSNPTQAKIFLEESLKSIAQSNSKKYFFFLAHLGAVYRALGDLEKAEKFLEKSLILYQEDFYNNKIIVAWLLTHLGAIHRELGDCEKGKDLLEKSLLIYKQYYPSNLNGIARASIHLGCTYRMLGNYESSRYLVEQGLIIYQQDPGNYNDIAWALVHLGIAYWGLGNYDKAKELIETGLTLYKNHFPGNKATIAWGLSYLGDIYRHLGNYKKAKSILKESFLIQQKLFGNNHVRIAWIFMLLGNLYGDLGDYVTAKNFLEKSITIYNKEYKKDLIFNSHALNNLGRIYLLENQLETAEKLFHQSLNMLQQSNHPERYACLENLSELFLKKSIQTANKGDDPQFKDFKVKAVDYITQALKIVKAYFPETSPHIIRIQSKLKSLEQGPS